MSLRARTEHLPTTERKQALMESAAWDIRLRNHEARLEANHDSIQRLRDTSSRHETEIKVTATEVRETRDDIAEMKKELSSARAEQKAEMIWVRRGLWAAAATFTMFVVALATLILQASH